MNQRSAPWVSLCDELCLKFTPRSVFHRQYSKQARFINKAASRLMTTKYRCISYNSSISFETTDMIVSDIGGHAEPDSSVPNKPKA